ncbi:hypothetical protein LAV84_28630 [Rhizobium sp. VS19-DR104.2]|uniref:hypothetical protein n=1 Tax=unclassified Rhizobium TaxID=2613769 RepID=UPI001C5A84D4|nr:MULTISPECIES: hypothetical protein [unclassified Rhizobium]MBZ5763460.1 hypothetical protein [Rhizobium sp. VS19-DR96]MBZ5769399.1 hypothetical protein [Rhizobium sp. VS19-DR129.2]MBZ5777206.1 hypothetical protein [Rhizobium sp. VS19-DRK62.2]MBZ5788027.1 hypothetical protein [Rhizobium sp. VS19-DR121]MBZ5805518.1 hypothetical protein [Rhizobium sp. VS19-DR181]
MTPDRFRECLNLIRWTSIDLVNSLHCDLAWIEALESGEVAIPGDVATWIETLAQCHSENQPPTTHRAVSLTLLNSPELKGVGHRSQNA